MADTPVTLHPIDHATVRIETDPSALAELSDRLCFDAPNAKFDSRVKRGIWDGKVRLIDKRSRTIHAGLALRVEELCRELGFAFRGLPRRSGTDVRDEAVLDFMDSIGIPPGFERRDYQVSAIRKAIATGRQLFLSPTSSGKSMMIYTIARWHSVKTLIVVPTTGLTIQMRDDFISYGCDPDSIALVGGGHKIDDIGDRTIVIGTWQSLYELGEDWFSGFGLVIGDEAHLFKAQSLTGIMLKMRSTPLRFGFTGTLDGSKIHQLVLEGLFGPTTKVTTTSDLMRDGHVAQLKIECVVLKHPRKGREELAGRIRAALGDPRRRQRRGAVAFMEETRYVYSCQTRNRFLAKMVTKLPGNNLLLFRTIDHGDALFDMIVPETSRPVHLINGGVEGLERNEIRQMIEDSDDAILLASLGTTSTGVSIRRINNLIMAAPLKSQVLTLQSIGRGLRRADDKDSVTVYDLADDLTMPGGKPNYALLHMGQRINIYKAESFDHRVSQVPLDY